MQHFKCVFFAIILLASSKGEASQTPIDSLEQYAKIAKQGWDQIDIAVGLARLYVFASDSENATKQINRVYQLSKKNDMPEGEAYALIIETLKANFIQNDTDQAIAHCINAMKIASQTRSADALVFAGYLLAENYGFRKGDWNKAEETLIELIPQIDASVMQKNIANSYKTLGYVYQQLGNYEKSLNNLDIALEIFKRIAAKPEIDLRINRVSAMASSPEKQVCVTLNYISDVYVKQGDVKTGLQYKLDALQVAKEANLPRDIAWMNANIGVLYSAKGDYTEALKYAKDGRLLYEEMESRPDIIWSNDLLVSILRKLRDYDVAEQYLNESIAFYTETNDSLFLSFTLLKAIDLQLDKEDWSAAQRLVDEADNLINTLNQTTNKARLEKVKGRLSLEKGDLKKSATWYLSALQLFTETGDEMGMARCEYEIANIFLKKEQYDSSAFYAKRALNHAESAQTIDFVRQCYLFLSKLYRAKGDYKSAYENHRIFFTFHDSVYTLNAQSLLKEEQVRQDIVGYKSDKELAEQNAQLLKEQNQMYLILGFVLFFFLLLLIYFYFNQRKIKTKIEVQNLQLSQLNQTKDRFFGIIAHDIRSPLLGLQSVGEQIDFFTKTQNPVRLKELSVQVESTTKKLTELLDNLLNWALLQNGMIPYRPEKVNLKEIMESVFVLLQPLADLKQIHFNNQVHKDVYVHADNKGVNTILRNIVSNALKFTDAGGIVAVDVKTEKDWAIVTINDTGTGIAIDRQSKLFDLEKESMRGTIGEKGSGLGLILCKELVELNKGTIRVISELGKGSSFIFNLPLSSLMT